MGMNAVYRGPEDCPSVIPVFPLPGALLLPRGQMPLNIFEPRYLAMVDEALKGDRIIGMVQPDADNDGTAPRAEALPGRLRRPHHAVRRDRRRALSRHPHRHRALPHRGGAAADRPVPPLPRRLSSPSRPISRPAPGEDEVDRAGVVKALRDFVEAAHVKVDWRGIEEAPNEALVNALCMMSPFGVREKQALLEAPNLKTRAEVLIALTEIELARGGAGSDSTLQ